MERALYKLNISVREMLILRTDKAIFTPLLDFVIMIKSEKELKWITLNKLI